MMPQQKQYTTYFLFVLVFSFLVIVFWIATNIYSRFIASTVDETLSIQTTPINPSFDETTINKLKSRQVVMPLNKLDAVETDISPTPAAEESAIEDLAGTPTPPPALSPIPTIEASTISSPTPTTEPGGAI